MKRVSYICTGCRHDTPNVTPFCEICNHGDMRESERQHVRYDNFSRANGYRAQLYLFDEQHINPLAIKRVIFNDPATIVIWADDTKTVVKANNESFDSEKGLAMAISKKVLGNKGNYFNEFKKWIPKE